MFAQEADPIQPVSLTTFPVWMACRVLLENLGHCMGQDGCTVLPLPKMGRPFTCFLLLLESSVLCVRHT